MLQSECGWSNSIGSSQCDNFALGVVEYDCSNLLETCAGSCLQECHQYTCTDHIDTDLCQIYRDMGKCSWTKRDVLWACRKTCGICHKFLTGEQSINQFYLSTNMLIGKSAVEIHFSYLWCFLIVNLQLIHDARGLVATKPCIF